MRLTSAETSDRKPRNRHLERSRETSRSLGDDSNMQRRKKGGGSQRDRERGRGASDLSEPVVKTTNEEM